MGKNVTARDTERMNHYRFPACGTPCAEDGFEGDLFNEPCDGAFFIGEPASCCAETAVYPPYVQCCRMTLTTGPLLLPRSGQLNMRLENPYPECVWAEVRIFDLHCGRRELLRAGQQYCRKMIKLAAHQTGTVSFDAAIPAGYLLEACVRTDGFVLPMLELDPMNGLPQMLCKSTEFLSLNACGR